MLASLRCLEAENTQLRNNFVSNTSYVSQTSISYPHSTVQPSSLALHNSFELLTEEEGCVAQEDLGGFTMVRRKKNRDNKRQKANYNQMINNSNKTRKIDCRPTPKRTAPIPFKNVTVIGDSHVRSLAVLIGERVRPGTVISGMCKPGAGIRSVKPNSIPPPAHCYVVMAGTNDIEAGRETVFFRHLEEVVLSCRKSSSVLVVPLTTRHDLHPKSSVHRTVNLVNSYMYEFCSRLQGVEMLDIGKITRHHYTTHGLHLREKGKRFLAGLIVERLARMTALHHLQRRRTTPSPPETEATTSSSLPAPTVLPCESYAEAVSRSDTNNSLCEKTQEIGSNSVQSNFLGNPIPVTGQN